MAINMRHELEASFCCCSKLPRFGCFLWLHQNLTDAFKDILRHMDREDNNNLREMVLDLILICATWDGLIMVHLGINVK